MKPIIRAFKSADEPLVIALLSGTMRTTWLPQLSARARAEIDIEARVQGYVQAMGSAFFVAEHNDTVAGMVHWESDFIHALHISPQCQRMGIGSALLTYAEREMAPSGVKFARLETDTFNAQSRAFYEKHGYSEQDRYPDTQWDSGSRRSCSPKRFSRRCNRVQAHRPCRVRACKDQGSLPARRAHCGPACGYG